MTTTLDRQADEIEAGPPATTRTLRVARYRHGETGPRWDRFEVPVPSPRTTVLDALTWIRVHLDPGLDVRHSCFHASCGTCGMRVDGAEVLACVTRLADVGDGRDEVTVEPLRNQPLVSDLVVDLESLAEAFEPVGMPLVRSSSVVPGSRPARGVPGLTRFEDCIECGLCVSACPIVASDAAYAGPAVLAAAWRVLDEPRDADPDRAAALVDGDQGAWRCHLAFECTAVCPSGALPAEGIMHLRRGLLGHRLRALLPHRPEGGGR
jgi:succinate dehydrogenase / fumarate reductase iron-sulfur subunit